MSHKRRTEEIENLKLFSIFTICNVEKTWPMLLKVAKKLFISIKNWLRVLPPLNNAVWVTSEVLLKLKILNFFLFFLFGMLRKTWPMLLKVAKISQKVFSSPSKIDSVFLPPLNKAAGVTNEALMKLKISNFFLFLLFTILGKTWPMLLKVAKISQKVFSSPSKIDSVFLPPLNNAAWVTNKALMKLKILNFFLFFLFLMLRNTWPVLLKVAKNYTRSLFISIKN